jgi:hypothetical protein
MIVNKTLSLIAAVVITYKTPRRSASEFSSLKDG